MTYTIGVTDKVPEGIKEGDTLVVTILSMQEGGGIASLRPIIRALGVHCWVMETGPDGSAVFKIGAPFPRRPVQFAPC